MINVAIMGHGVVGSGVAEILIGHADRISEKTKTPVNVKYILDLRDFDGLSYSGKFIKDLDIVMMDTDIDMIYQGLSNVCETCKNL